MICLGGEVLSTSGPAAEGSGRAQACGDRPAAPLPTAAPPLRLVSPTLSGSPQVSQLAISDQRTLVELDGRLEQDAVDVDRRDVTRGALRESRGKRCRVRP